jgi:hypothetical protein
MLQAFLIDIVMIVLLILAIAFCWNLNNRMNNVKEMGKDILPSVKTLSGVISKISEHLDLLKSHTKKAEGLLTQDIPVAKQLKDDLEILLEYSESSAKNLEILIDKAKQTEIDLREIHEIVVRSFPKNFKDSLQQNNITIDFDEMKKLKVADLKNFENGAYDALSELVIPMRIEEILEESSEFPVDESLRIAVGDLR